MTITIDEETLFETVLSYALYGGALFQFICILAVMILPENNEMKVKENGRVEGPTTHQKAQIVTGHRGKKEKKKHR